MNTFLKRIVNAALNPYPLRSATLWLIKRFSIGSYEQRVRLGAVERPHYGFCVYNAAKLAKSLGYAKISVLEFGVAGGRGLLDLESHAHNVRSSLGIEVEIYGFDSGTGLPAPLDYRDLPYHWKKGFYKMDVEKLKSRLTISKLVLGEISDTRSTFFEHFRPATVGAIMFDFDFYSSTAAAMQLLESAEHNFLPRVFCYFDDVIGTEIPLYSDYTGERLAINEFNSRHNDRKLGLPYFLLAQKVSELWYHKIWIFHLFNHAKYNQFVSDEDRGHYELS